MRKSSKKLALDKQVVRNLSKDRMTDIVGGRAGGTTTDGGTDAQCSAAGSGCGPGNGDSNYCEP